MVLKSHAVWARLQLRAPSPFQLHTVICLECYSENTGATGGIIFAYWHMSEMAM